MKEKIFIFDRFDNVLAVTNNYITAKFSESVEKPKSFTIEFPVSDEDAEHLVGGNQVAFRDLKGNFRLFTIREIDDQDGESTEKVVECMPGMQELTDVMVEERRPQDRDAEYVLGLILENSRWKVGDVAELGKNSTSFYFKDAYECLGELTKLWGGEIVDRIEIKDNKIVGRYIDIVERKGSDTGKRFEIDKDIQNITRTVLYYPKTALYGKGSSLENENDEGETSYTRKITFRDVVWSEDDGDPVDKPAGQEWVGDPEALEQHGIPNHDTGEMMHRFGLFEDNDEEDPEQLLAKTWQAVQDEKDPKAQYEMSIMTFYDITGYEHEQAFLGDTGIARDKSIKPMILIESRIMEWEYDIGDPSNGDLILGNVLDLNPDDSKIDWVIDKVEDNAGNWDSGGGPITDDRFPDIKPDVPTNITADGLFKVIQLSWDFESTYAIANYEVYASEINGFAPDSTNLVYRGKTGGYNHQADTDEKWYFRVRAVNTHGTASEYSEQVSASTVQLDLPDLEDIVPDFIEYSIYEGDEPPDPSDYKYWINTGESPQLLYRWDDDAEDWIPLSPVSPEDIGAVEKGEYQDKINDIISDLEEKAGLEYVDGQLKSKADQSVVDEVKKDLADKVDAEWVNGKLVSKVDRDTYEEKMEETEKEIAEKAGFDYVDGELKYKADSEDLEEANIEIKKNAEEIATKASASEVDAISGTVEENKSSIKQNADEIKSKVSQSSYDTDQEDTIERFESNESSISQNAKDIESKVSQTEYNGLKEQVSEAETSITQNAKEIKSKASQEELDSTNKSVEDNTSEITQNAKEIASKVSQEEYNDLSDDVSKNTSSISQQADQIASKVDSTEYKEDKDGIISDISSNSSAIEQNASEISSKVSQTEYDEDIKGEDGLKNQMSNAQTEITQNADSIQSKAEQSEVDTVSGKVDSNTSSIEQNAKKIESKVDSTTYDEDKEGIISDINSNSSRITQTEKDITSKVDSTTYKSDKDSLEKSIENNTSEIEQNAESIKSKVDSTAYESDKDGIVNDIADNKSEIEQNAEAITSKVDANYVDGEIGKIEVGGRNLLKNSTTFNSPWDSEHSTGKKDPFGDNHAVKMDGSNQYLGYRVNQIDNIDKFTKGKYTLSFWAKSDSGESKLIRVAGRGGLNFVRSLSIPKEWTKFTFSSSVNSEISSGRLVYFDNKGYNTDIKPYKDIYIAYPQLKKGNKATDWTPAPEDVDSEIESVREYASEIEQTAEGIRSDVTSVEKEFGDWKESQTDVNSHLLNEVNEAQSSIEQNSDSIESKVSEETYKVDMDNMTTRVSKAESSITQNADEITSRVSKNGVVSSINQSPEEIKIDTERLSIDGDLLVENGKIYIKDEIITNSMIAGDAKIDFAKIADVKITNAMIDSVNANKINAGILDAEKVLVQVKNGTQAIQIDDKGFESVDSSGNTRIHIGVRNIGGKGQSDPSTIRFFSGSGSTSAGVGMNVNDTFVIGSDSSKVPMELYSGKNTIIYAAQLRIKPNGTSDGEYARFASVNNTDGSAREVAFQPNSNARGYIGSSSYRWWRVYAHHIHWKTKHTSSSRELKTNIFTVPIEELNDAFNKLEFKSFNYLKGNNEAEDETTIGLIAEESPDEILVEDEDGEKTEINDMNLISVIGGALKHQQSRIDDLESYRQTISSQHDRIAELEIQLDKLAKKMEV